MNLEKKILALEAVKTLEITILDLIPESKERGLAIQKFREGALWLEAIECIDRKTIYNEIFPKKKKYHQTSHSSNLHHT